MRWGSQAAFALSLAFLGGSVWIVYKSEEEEKAKMHVGVSRDDALYAFKLSERRAREAKSE